MRAVVWITAIMAIEFSSLIRPALPVGLLRNNEPEDQEDRPSNALVGDRRPTETTKQGAWWTDKSQSGAPSRWAPSS